MYCSFSNLVSWTLCAGFERARNLWSWNCLQFAIKSVWLSTWYFLKLTIRHRYFNCCGVFVSGERLIWYHLYNSRVFIGLAIMGYEPLYHKYHKYGKRTHEFLGPFYIYFTLVFNILEAFLVIPLELVGHEMILASWALRASFPIYHLISNVRMWNNC